MAQACALAHAQGTRSVCAPSCGASCSSCCSCCSVAISSPERRTGRERVRREGWTEVGSAQVRALARAQGTRARLRTFGLSIVLVLERYSCQCRHTPCHLWVDRAVDCPSSSDNKEHLHRLPFRAPLGLGLGLHRASWDRTQLDPSTRRTRIEEGRTNTKGSVERRNQKRQEGMTDLENRLALGV